MTGGTATELARAAWPDVPSDALVLLPVGSTEQHGPHLPLDTDSVIAHAVARRASTALPCTLVAPTLAYGASGEHAGFPGTVSIGHEALRAVLVESVRSLSLWAARTVLVNGHGGNTATLDTAVRLLRAEGHDVVWTGCSVTRRRRTRRPYGDLGDAPSRPGTRAVGGGGHRRHPARCPSSSRN
ncbi:mycofactocin biosynthesis peptidyl-dipeptidase MftE [Streptomyces sp. L7]